MSKIKDASLESLAKKLEGQSGALDTSLEKIQGRLNALGLPAEVWAKARLSESDWRHIEETGADEFEIEELGYGPYGSDWALLVRTRRFVRCWNSEDRCLDEEWFDEWSPEPLLQASRQVRIAAVGVLPELIEKLQEASREAIESITQAKVIADSLELAR